MTWEYRRDVETDDDVVKIQHEAVRDGESVIIHHSPYERMTAAGFAAHAFLSFPAPLQGNWRNASIIAYAKANGWQP